MSIKKVTLKFPQKLTFVKNRRSSSPSLLQGPVGLSVFASKRFSRTIFSILFRASNRQIVDKKNKLNLLLKLSYLNSIFALTLGYLNPALDNPAPFYFRVRAFSIFVTRISRSLEQARGSGENKTGDFMRVYLGWRWEGCYTRHHPSYGPNPGCPNVG